jgi:hypothetical protein
MNKLRPDRSITGFLPAIIVLMAFFISLIYFGMTTAYNVIGLGFWVVGIIQMIIYTKTRNTGYLISTIYVVLVGIFVFSLDIEALQNGQRLSNTSALLGVICLFLMGWLLYMLATRQIKWKGRAVFELAARRVNEVSNGFTERPKPAGKADYTIDEVQGFSQFMARTLVCLPYFDSSKLYLIPVPQGKEMGMALGPGYKLLNRSWVSFDEYGDVTVHIAKSDYMNYRDTLSFDQLCDSLGCVLIEFLELYKRGEGVMIINRLDSIRSGIFS